jgi:hypothetical protein
MKMKTLVVGIALISMAFMTQGSLRAAQPVAGGCVTSPDHPSTWTSGADNVHQALRWDPDKHMLFADVKYSTILYADDTHPTEDNDYTLSFPTVRLDPASGVFTANGMKIGTLHRGFFGSNIVLDKSVELNIHRHHGRIFAMIVPSEDNA